MLLTTLATAGLLMLVATSLGKPNQTPSEQQRREAAINAWFSTPADQRNSQRVHAANFQVPRTTFRRDVKQAAALQAVETQADRQRQQRESAASVFVNHNVPHGQHQQEPPTAAGDAQQQQQQHEQTQQQSHASHASQQQQQQQQKPIKLCPCRQATVLTAAEEVALANLCLEFTDRNISIDRHQVSAFVIDLLETNPRTHQVAQKWLKDRRVGKKWFKKFLKRHPDLRLRYSSRLDHRRLAVTKEELNSLYDKLDEIYR